MSINEKGEFIRPSEAPKNTSPEIKKANQQEQLLAEQQEAEPDSNAKTSSDKKAAMRRRLLGE
jgi:hypothetical protein